MAGLQVAPLVNVQHVSVVAGGRTLLQDVSLSVYPGEALRLAGPNGGGKTTLLRLLAGEVAPVSGQRVYGLGGGVQASAVQTSAVQTSAVQLSAVQARRTLSVVGPDAEAFYLTREWQQTVLDVLLAGYAGERLNLWQAGHADPAALARAQQVAKQTGLTALLERDIRTLSHGQRRRVMLARALMPAPELLLLDEFTDGLSRSARAELGELLRQIHAGGTALVLATHRPDEAPALGWRTLWVEGGKVTDAQGSAAKQPPAPRPARPVAQPALLSRPAPLVCLTDASVYRNGHHALGPVTWTWHTGQHWLVTGENGSGKSTLARLIAGEFHPARGGTVARPFLRRDVQSERRRAIGLVGAELGIRQRFSLSGREWLGRDVIASAFGGTEGFAEEVSREEWQQVDALAEQLEVSALLSQAAETLSQGQLRRLLLARAVVHRPRLLLLDEGLDFLDAHSRDLFMNLLPELLAGGTHLMVIAHRHSDAPALLTHHLELAGGKVTGLRGRVASAEG